MATSGQPTLYRPAYCEPAHNDCPLGATAARVDAASESMRHAAE
jgi:hypothetical protein